MYRQKTCRHCGEIFAPTYSNQKYHAKCRRAQRRKYQNAYQRDYQRKVRRELKQNWGIGTA